jgi:cell division protease FtsH
MSVSLGPLTFGKKEEQIFLGREITTHKDYSEQTAVAIDREIKLIVMGNYDKARSLLQANLETLHALAAALLEKEVLDGPEIDAIIAAAEAGSGTADGTVAGPSDSATPDTADTSPPGPAGGTAAAEA